MDYSELYKTFRRQHPDAPSGFEDVVRFVYTDILKNGSVAIDCGAHTGKHTIPMALAVRKLGRVFAFEPIPEKARILSDAVIREKLIGTVSLYNCAVSDKPGRQEFSYVRNDPGKSAFFLRNEVISDKKKAKSIQKFEVEVTTLDEQLINLPCSFIKIDVEGAEFNVLRGAEQIILSRKPALHFEMGTPSLNAFGISIGDIYEFLKARCSYDIVDVLGNEMPSKDVFIESGAANGVYDYFAAPKTIDLQGRVASAAGKRFGK